jgi:hypothetical protein
MIAQFRIGGDIQIRRKEPQILACPRMEAMSGRGRNGLQRI